MNNLVYFIGNRRAKLTSTPAISVEKFDGKFLIPNIIWRQPFEVFMLFVRLMEETGNENGDHIIYDMSRLSKGVQCGMQGRESIQNYKEINDYIFF